MSVEWKGFIKKTLSAPPEEGIKLGSARKSSGALKETPNTYATLGGEKPTMTARKVFIREGSYSSLCSPDAELPDAVSDRVREAVQIAEGLEDVGVQIDCVAFGALLGGGEVYPSPYKNYEEGAWKKLHVNSKIDTVVSTAEVDEHVLPTMQPLGIGILREDGGFAPNHAIVKIPEADLTDAPQYISKLGGREVVITNLKGIAAYYDATHIAPITEIVCTSGRRKKPAIRYSNDPSQDHGSPS
jgi:hypothetical protein